MPEITLGQVAEQRQARRPGGRGLGVVLGGLVLVILASGAWYGWHTGWLRAALQPTDTRTTTAPAATPSATTAAIVAQGNLIATNAALAEATAKLTALQQRLAELNSQTLAASDQATRAEALLVAAATRRAIERGQPLGMFETALRARFGASQLAAVNQIVAAAQKPVTIGGLTDEFTRLQPRLSAGSASESAWDWVSHQVESMFVIRHDDTPSPTAESRLARARAALAGQRIDLAIAEVERMPGKEAATDWLVHARDWQNTQHALDQIETAALTIPPAAPLVAKPVISEPVVR